MPSQYRDILYNLFSKHFVLFFYESTINKKVHNTVKYVYFHMWIPKYTTACYLLTKRARNSNHKYLNVSLNDFIAEHSSLVEI